MKMKKFLAASLLAAVAVSASGCSASQGVTEDTIWVGNTAATSGVFASVGVPFNAGLEAALNVYNKAGGFGENGLQVKLKHYDDGFKAAEGVTYTQKLVEEDQVFALVGHFGSDTVSATVDYIKETGIPMVYAATGVSGLYNKKAEGNEKAVMSVQPIYDSEGSVLLARALGSTEGNLGLGGKKIGVISTTDEAGNGLLNGVKSQAELLPEAERNKIVYVTTDEATGTNHTTAVNALKSAGCDVVIVCANQGPFTEIMNTFKTSDYDNVKVITSYVSANTTLAGTLCSTGVVTETRQVYTTAWLDITSSTYVYKPEATNVIGTLLWNGYKALVPLYYDNGVPGFSEDYWEAAEAIFEYSYANNVENYQTAFTNSFNSYALAGYIAGTMFTTGLERVDAKNRVLTWNNYIKAMEEDFVDVPMGGSVDFRDGKRVGIQDLALNKFGLGLTGGELQVYSPITPIDTVWESVK